MLRVFLPALFALVASSAIAQQPYTTWRDYGGTADAAQYSALKQIHKGNVRQLQVAWRFATGDNNKYSFNPLVVDDVMFVMAKNSSRNARNPP